jgi:GntR family transcriptional regulator/MocR family aminotransferase
MHLLAWLPGAVDETAVLRTAARAGIRLDGVQPYRLDRTGPAGLIFGYAAINESAVPDAVRTLARALRSAGAI